MSRQAGRGELRADARENRRRILEAAEAVFAEHGASVPIDEIARRAGVGPGTLYRHFPDKTALLKAIVLERFERLMEEARQLATNADAGAAFFSFLRRLVNQGATKRDLADALADMGYDLKSQSGEMAKARAAVERLLTRAQAAGAVRRDVTVGDVFALIASIIRAGDAKGRDAAGRDRLLAIVSDGLRDRQRPEPRPPRSHRS